MQMRKRRNKIIYSRGRDFTKNDDIFLRLSWYLGQGITEENIEKSENDFEKHFNISPGARRKKAQPTNDREEDTEDTSRCDVGFSQAFLNSSQSQEFDLKGIAQLNGFQENEEKEASAALSRIKTEPCKPRDS